jgi:hypothetical protein
LARTDKGIDHIIQGEITGSEILAFGEAGFGGYTRQFVFLKCAQNVQDDPPCGSESVCVMDSIGKLHPGNGFGELCTMETVATYFVAMSAAMKGTFLH